MLEKVILIITLITLTVSPTNYINNHGKQITIINIKNNPDKVIKPNNEFPFYLDKVENEDYDILLNNYIYPGMDKKYGISWREEDTWSKATKLRMWVREFLDKGGWIKGNQWLSKYDRELITIQEILDNREKGLDGLCSYYANFYMHCCLALGINNRRVGWWQPDGDQLNEVYIPEWRKWVAVSPLFNAWFSDKNGNALSIIELNYHKHAKTLNEVITQRDSQTTYPDPEIRKNWLANYSWDIYYWNKNGYLLLDSSKAYRYENPKSWPYNHLNSKIIIKSTQDKNVINFDASLIKISAKVKHSKVIINIDDFSVINFKEFVWIIKNKHGLEINKGTFNSNKCEIEMKNLDKGDYTLFVYALNTRSGKSQIVEIELTI